MKDKLLQIRVDEDFLSKLEYLRKINDYKSNAETIRTIVEKEFRKEAQQIIVVRHSLGESYLCPECKSILGDTSDMPRFRLISGLYCHNCGTFCKKELGVKEIKI